MYFGLTALLILVVGSALFYFLKGTVKRVLICLTALVLLVVAHVAFEGLALGAIFSIESDDNFSSEVRKSVYRGKGNCLDSEFPKFMQGFTSKEEVKGQISIYDKYKFAEIYEPEIDNKLLSQLDGFLPENLKDYETKLAKSIFNLTKEPKNSVPPAFEELLSKSSFPRLKELRNTSRMWLYLSLKYRNKKPLVSLMLSHGCYYVASKLVSNYMDSSSILSCSFAETLRNFGSVGILRYASRPNKKMRSHNKRIAKDILDLIDSTYPISWFIKGEKSFLKLSSEYIAEKNSAMKAMIDMDEYDQYCKIVFDEPISFIDKPYMDIADQLKKFESKIANLSDNVLGSSFGELFMNILFPKSFSARMYVLIHRINFTVLKKNREYSLALMEMASVALVLNAYFSEKSSLPESIEDLETWFGHKLPVDRLTGKPYELNLNGDYILYNPGIDGIKDTTDDFCFKLNLN